MSVECKNRTESDLDIKVEFDYPFRSVSHSTAKTFTFSCIKFKTINRP